MYSRALPSTYLVLVHLEPPRDFVTLRVQKHISVTFYVMKSDSFRCPDHSPDMVERVGGLFKPGETRLITEDQHDMDGDGDGDGDEESKAAEGRQEEQLLKEEMRRVVQEQIEQYMDQIQQAYRRCYAKAVYTHLRSYGSINSQDLERCLEVMQESHVDIDLTELFQVFSISAPPSYAFLQEQFASKIAATFSRTPFPSNPYFYYQPSRYEDALNKDAQADNYDELEEMEYDSYDSKSSHAASALELCPVFIGEAEGDIDNKEASGIYSIPLFMRMEEIMGPSEREVVTALPLPDSGTAAPATLRFVCLVLPPLLGPAKLVHECISHVMHDTRMRISSLISTEILSALLVAPTLTEAMLSVAARHLHLLPSIPLISQHVPNQHHTHRAEFDLQFVDRREGNKLFPQELKANIHPRSSPHNPTLVYLGCDLYQVATHVATPNLARAKGPKPYQQLEYWLLVSCQLDSVKAIIFSPSASVSEDATNMMMEEQFVHEPCASIWNGVREGINAVSRRVNQLILLYHLHESRICAELLLPSDSPAPHTPTRTPRDDKGEGRGRATTFRPGEFECPLVHTITLALHDRIPPAAAVRALISALHPFEVSNRKTLFVYHEQNGRIFYISLHTAAAVNPQSPPSTPSTTVDTPMHQVSPPASPMPAGSATSQAYIILNVYGVDPAGPEITQHLHQLLETKLTSATLSNISHVFLRNPHLKVTTEDLDFLRPPSSDPQCIFVKVPAFVDNPFLFLLFLKQNLGQFLHPMNLSQAAQQREDSGGVLLQSLVHPEDTSEVTNNAQQPASDCFEIRQSEFLLMYNHVLSPTSTPRINAIGQGMACISLSLTSSQDTILSHVPRTSINGSSQWSLEDLQVQFADAPLPITQPGYHALLRVWSPRLGLGSTNLNMAALVDYLILCANQTLCEYVMDTVLLPSTVPATIDSLPSFVSRTELVLGRARHFSAPSVFENSFSISIPSWAMHSFLTELRDIMADSITLHHSIFSCHEDSNGARTCTPYPSASMTHGDTELCGGSTSIQCGDCDDDCMCTTTSALNFYNYDPGNVHASSSAYGLDCSDSVSTVRPLAHPHGFYFILGGKKLELSTPSKYSQPEQHTPAAHFYRPIKDSQFTEPIARQCVAIARLDLPQPNQHEQKYKITFCAYNWDQSKLDHFVSLCSRLVNIHTLRQHLVGTILHHKLGLFQHQPSLSPAAIVMPGSSAASVQNISSRLSWDNVEAIVGLMPLARRRTTATDVEKSKEESYALERELHEQETKKSRPDMLHFRPSRSPAMEFDSIFQDHYPPIYTPSPNLHLGDPLLQQSNQSRALAAYIEQRAALRMTALGSISILPAASALPTASPNINTSTNTIPNPQLTASQLDSVIAIARLVHFRCVPFLFGDQVMAFGPTTPSQPTLPMLDAFVQDYIYYLNEFGVVPLLIESTMPTTNMGTKRASSRAYLQKVFLDGTLLVKISFRDVSVACELFAVPQLNPPAHSHLLTTFHPPTLSNFDEEMTRFTRCLHLNSFTYDFHVNQLYRMIKSPSVLPLSPAQPIISVLQALHQYYPSPPLHASTCLDSVSITCPLLRLASEGPEITTTQILDFMMADVSSASNPTSPLHHIGIIPAILLTAPPPVPYSELCAVVCSKAAITNSEQDGGGGAAGGGGVAGGGGAAGGGGRILGAQSDDYETEPKITSGLRGEQQMDTISLHIFVLKVGEICLTVPPHSHLPSSASSPSAPPSSNAQVITTLRKAVATSAIHCQREQLWNKLLQANPYAPALSYNEFHVLMNLVHSRPVTHVDGTLTHPVNLLRMGPNVWGQLHSHLRQVNMERSRQVFMDPVRHLLIFHPSNNSQLIHFLWDEALNEANISLCRLDERTVGSSPNDQDEMEHLSRVVNVICHYLWRHVILR